LEALTVRVRVGDVRLFFEVFGQEWVFTGSAFERRHVLIGLHGGPGLDGTKLRYQLAPLAEVAQVVVPDQRGHGRSDRGSSETWNVTTWAADVKNVADALSIERPVVLGFSFGGGVALRYASTFPEHPAGLILISTSTHPPTSQETIERFREVGGDEAAEVHRRDVEAPSEETGAEWARVCFPLLSRRREPDPLLEQLEAWRFENQSLDVNLHHAAAAKATELPPALGAVRCPTLVLIGEHDPLIPLRQAHEIVEAIPDGLARLQPVPEAAHDVFADNPEHTYSCIREFLAGLG
jgi:pimeloyl-ACP methyl ester carboxylesterase